MSENIEIWRGTILECWNVAKAKMGRDPYGMLLKDRPWPEVVRRTYQIKREYARSRRPL